MKKVWLLFVSLWMVLTLLGCNAFVPKVTPTDQGAFLYHYEVLTPNPTVGEEITVIATVTNDSGYAYWIEMDQEICHFGSEDFVYDADFDRRIRFSNHEILTSTHQITYDEAGIHYISVHFEFGIDGTSFECIHFISIDVLESPVAESSSFISNVSRGLLV